MLSGILLLNTTFASSAPAGALEPISERFGLSEIAGTLMTSLFVMGYLFGPLLWGPVSLSQKLQYYPTCSPKPLQLSEIYARRPIFLIPFTCYTLMQAGNALAPNTAALLIFRFLGGFFAAAPMTNAGYAFAFLKFPSLTF